MYWNFLFMLPFIVLLPRVCLIYECAWKFVLKRDSFSVYWNTRPESMPPIADTGDALVLHYVEIVRSCSLLWPSGAFFQLGGSIGTFHGAHADTTPLPAPRRCLSSEHLPAFTCQAVHFPPQVCAYPGERMLATEYVVQPCGRACLPLGSCKGVWGSFRLTSYLLCQNVVMIIIEFLEDIDIF